MLGPNEQQNSVTLPEGLRRQFAELEQRLWRVESLQAGAIAGIGLALSFLMQFLSDRFWDTPAGLRLAFTLAGVAVLAGAAVWWCQRWILKRRNTRALARLVQEKYRRLGDRLLGIVELTEEQHHLPDFSPALYRAAIHQVATEALEYDFAEAVSARAAKRCLAACASLLGLLLAPTVLVPAATGNAFVRWMAPTADIARYTLVRLERLPAEKVVAHGEPFAVECAVRYRSFWKPSRVVARVGRQPKIESTVADDTVRLRVPAQVESGTLRLRVGDAVATVAVQPTHRPSLKELAARLELPGYLQYPSLEEKIQNGSLAVLEGSRAAFHGKANRPLNNARLQLAGQSPLPLRLQEADFTSDVLDLGGVPHVGFTWEDHFGLESSGPWRLAIQAQKDLPPTPELPDLSREVAILETEVLQIKVAAKDDFGVRDLALEWDLAADWKATNQIVKQEFKGRAGTPQEKKLEKSFRFSPAVLRIPADTLVELRATATDFFPGRQPSESPVYRVFVLGNERHAEMIRQRLESLLVHLEEISRLEEKIADTTRDLKALSEQKLAADEATKQLGELKDSQAQNATNLEELSKDGTKLLREAMRNPTIPEETVREWSKNLQTMQDVAQGQMKQASQSLSAAQQNAQARAQNVGDALEQEEAALAALEQLQKQVNQNLDQLQALTLAQRLRKLGGQEKDIETQLQRLVPETIGMLPRELPSRFKRINDGLAGDQTATQAESQVLQGEISRFFERTQQENYGEVSKQMTEARTPEELERLRDLIRENIAMQAMQGLAAWGKRFDEWANLLEPKKDSNSGGGGGEGGGQDLTKHLIALLRLRDQEINLREQTRLVEQKKDDREVYRGLATFLAVNQERLREGLEVVRKELPIAILEPPMRETDEAMAEATEVLKRPQTDAAAEQAETKVVELLSDVINLIVEQAQPGSGGESEGQQEDMAFLMQMMSQEPGMQPGMTTGQRGGGSMAGGSTDRRATPQEGDARGRGAEGRRVSRAGGRPTNLPAEFREALESYFNAIE
jgi:hypothetical protein